MGMVIGGLFIGPFILFFLVVKGLVHLYKGNRRKAAFFLTYSCTALVLGLAMLFFERDPITAMSLTWAIGLGTINLLLLPPINFIFLYWIYKIYWSKPQREQTLTEVTGR